MKMPFYAVVLIYVLLSFSCTHTPFLEVPNISPQVVLKDFTTWYNYNYNNIKLSKDYKALDISSKTISRETFLKSLSSGDYVAFRLNTFDSSLKYQLFKLSPSIDNYIRAEAKQFGEGGYQKYKMEGMEVPDFNYTDLNGKVYNKANTKGKIVVLKCWFINCTVCVQEMPALNAVVKEFESRDDVLFISLAFDSKQKLKMFLTKTKFDYAVIQARQEYIQEKLRVREYPTQFIINRHGLITKVVNDYHDMISSLKDELAK